MFLKISKNNAAEYMDKYAIIVCRLRNSRIKSKQVAIMEMAVLLYDLEGIFLVNGPLSEVKGLFCYMLPIAHVKHLTEKLVFAGYSHKFYLIDFINLDNETDLPAETRLWKGRKFGILNLLTQDEEIYKAQSPHNRPFVIKGSDGINYDVKGYRGDGSDLGRRALPVEDCRCLVNLAMPHKISKLTDPFAGAGGIVYTASYINPDISVTSVDIDPILAPGLKSYGAVHFTEDAAVVRLNDFYDALVTEIPFDIKATEHILRGLENIYRRLKPAAHVVVMCAEQQADMLTAYFTDSGLFLYVKHSINRKGTPVFIIAGTLDNEFEERIKPLAERVLAVY